MKTFGTFRVVSKGVNQTSVAFSWPEREQEPVEMLDWGILEVSRVVTPGDVPKVQITFMGLLEEVNAEEES